MTTSNFLRDTSESVDRYSEQWKIDHDQTMECLEFEEKIALGISVCQFIDRTDAIWRAKIKNSPESYNPKVDESIELLYRAWLKPVPMVFEKLSEFERQDFEVVGAEEFRSVVEHAERTAKLFEGLRIGKEQLDRGDRIPFADSQKKARAVRRNMSKPKRPKKPTKPVDRVANAI